MTAAADEPLRALTAAAGETLASPGLVVGTLDVSGAGDFSAHFLFDPRADCTALGFPVDFIRAGALEYTPAGPGRWITHPLPAGRWHSWDPRYALAVLSGAVVQADEGGELWARRQFDLLLDPDAVAALGDRVGRPDAVDGHAVTGRGGILEVTIRCGNEQGTRSSRWTFRWCDAPGTITLPDPADPIITRERYDAELEADAFR